MPAPASYLLAAARSGTERLHLQARVWEPAARALIADLDLPLGDARVLDVGCGAPAAGCRSLAERVPERHVVVGTDLDPEQRLDSAAREACDARRPTTTSAAASTTTCSQRAARRRCSTSSTCASSSASAGRAADHLGACAPPAQARRHPRRRGARHAAPGPTSPTGPRLSHADRRIAQAFGAAPAATSTPGAASRRLLARPPGRRAADVRTHLLGLEPGHAYLRLPLQLAASLEPQLGELLGADELDDLLTAAAARDRRARAAPARRSRSCRAGPAWPEPGPAQATAGGRRGSPRPVRSASHGRQSFSALRIARVAGERLSV